MGRYHWRFGRNLVNWPLKALLLDTHLSNQYGENFSDIPRYSGSKKICQMGSYDAFIKFYIKHFSSSQYPTSVFGCITWHTTIFSVFNVCSCSWVFKSFKTSINYSITWDQHMNKINTQQMLEIFHFHISLLSVISHIFIYL